MGEREVVYEFLYDLAAGLTLTIAGFAIRQVRTLSAPSEREPATAAQCRRPSSSPCCASSFRR